jgi:GNAT superfamily N-acetyltransferase
MERDVTITYLEQTERPVFRHAPRPPGKIAFLRVDRPSIRYYRYLYDMVGRPWHWRSRRNKTDDEIAALIHAEGVSLFVLVRDGEPIGMAELVSEMDVTFLRFFGLAPEHIGVGLGRYFLTNVLDIAWAAAPRKMRLETCTLDHPAALALYQKFGFVVYDQVKERITLPGTQAP